MQYSNGQNLLSILEMEARGPMGWIHRRTVAGWNLGDGLAGPGWKVSGLLQLVQTGTLVNVVNGTTSIRSFQDNGDSTFTAANWYQDTLVSDSLNHLLTLTDPLGSRWVFYDLSANWNPARQGRLKQATNAAGNTTDTIYGTSGVTTDKILEVDQTDVDPTKVTRITYNYNLTGLTAGQLSSVLYERVISGTPTTVRQANYTYYSSGGPNGPAGALQWSKVTDGASVIDVYYHRYDTSSNTPVRLVMGPTAYDRAKASLGSEGAIDAASDATLGTWADYVFTNGTFNGINSIASESVQGTGCSCGTSGGTGAYSFVYTNSSFGPGSNAWAQKAVETLPDGNQNIIYTDSGGATMLEVFKEVSTGSQWMTYHQYDSQRREILTALPSAVLGYDESQAALVTGSNLSASSGLYHVYGFYATTDLPNGAIAGYRSTTSIKQGSAGTLVPQKLTKYASHTDGGGNTVYPISSVTHYRNSDGTGAIITTFSYTWQGSTSQVLERTTTYPAVLALQNGSGTNTSAKDQFDAFGRTIWSMDEGGFIGKITYDNLSGGVLQTIIDVNSSVITTPSGWTTPAGGGLHLVTDFELDSLGRATKVTDPLGHVSYAVYKDVDFEVRIYPSWDPSTNMPTGPTSLSREDRAGSYSESLTMSAAPAVISGRPTGTESVSGLQSLIRTYRDTGDRPTYLDSYFDFSSGGFTYSTSTNIGTQGVNFYRSTIGYDTRGFMNRELAWDGTIGRIVHDARGRVASTWIGTSDTPPSGDWSPSNNSAPSNMIQQTASHYDNDGVGDGNLTLANEFTSPSTSLDMAYAYDFRNRKTDLRGPNKVAVRATYDNLDRAVVSQAYADANANFVIDSNELRRRSETLFDERGQVFQNVRTNVDPVTGALGNALTSNAWYNTRRFAIKTMNSNGLFRKTQYDGAGRATATFVSYDSSETTFAQAADVTGDTVIEESVPTYDADGNVLQTTRYQRSSSATLTGDLATSWVVGDSRRTFTALWYDLANRMISVADYGTNGNASFTRPSTPPAPNSSPQVLVIQLEFDAAGRQFRSTNNLGKTTQSTFNGLSRMTRVIQNYVDGVVGETELDTDKTTDTGYDSVGRMSQLVAYNPKGAGNGVEQQVTQYVYGTIANQASPAVFRNDVLVATIFPDSDDTYNPLGSPGTQLGNGTDGVFDRTQTTYDYAGRISTTTDQRGVVHTMTYDPQGRLQSDAATTVPSGVDASLRRIEYAYDDLSRERTVSSYDAVSGGTLLNQVKHTYDGWGNDTLCEQSHTDGVIVGTPSYQTTYAEGASGGQARFVRPSSYTYPNGRVVNVDYPGTIDDKLSRAARLSHSTGSPIYADYTYLGTGSIVKIDHPQVTGGFSLDYGAGTGSPAGWDQFGRIISQKWGSTADPQKFDRRDYTYNNMSQRLTSDMIYTGAPTIRDEQYTYDSLHRLKSMKRGTLAGGTITDAASKLQFDWNELDVMGNWRTWRTDPNGGVPAWKTQARKHNKANEIDVDNNDANAAGASITQLTGTGMDWLDPTYDKAGNLVSGPRPSAETAAASRLLLTYDAWNRLVIAKKNSGVTLAEYQYDGTHQRIVKLIPNGTKWNRTDYYYNNAQQVLEERTITAVVGKTTAATVPKMQWVWDLRYIDAPILRDENKDGDGDCIDGTDERLYFAQDANFNTITLVSTAGVVIERNAYDPYGEAGFFSMAWASHGQTAHDNEILYSGYRFDPETELYHVRRRTYHPTLGRFLQRDPAGYHDGMNLYEYVGSDPYKRTDPSGLAGGYLYLGIPPLPPPKPKRRCNDPLPNPLNLPNVRRGAVSGGCSNGNGGTQDPPGQLIISYSDCDGDQIKAIDKALEDAREPVYGALELLNVPKVSLPESANDAKEKSGNSAYKQYFYDAKGRPAANDAALGTVRKVLECIDDQMRKGKLNFWCRGKKDGTYASTSAKGTISLYFDFFKANTNDKRRMGVVVHEIGHVCGLPVDFEEIEANLEKLPLGQKEKNGKSYELFIMNFKFEYK